MRGTSAWPLMSGLGNVKSYLQATLRFNLLEATSTWAKTWIETLYRDPAYLRAQEIQDNIKFSLLFLLRALRSLLSHPWKLFPVSPVGIHFCLSVDLRWRVHVGDNRNKKLNKNSLIFLLFDMMLWFGCGRQQKRHAATTPLAGVWRRMERNRQKLVGRDKGSLTEQQTKGTRTTTIQVRGIHKTNRTTHRATLPDWTDATHAPEPRVSSRCPAPPPA